MSHAALAARMGEVGYPVSRTAISEIENGARRVSVDDLTALAIGLGVNPNALLLPPIESPVWLAQITGTGFQTTGRLWTWARGVGALWPRQDDAETPEERARLIEHMDGEFKTAIAPSPMPRADDDLRAVGLVVHPRDLQGVADGDG